MAHVSQHAGSPARRVVVQQFAVSVDGRSPVDYAGPGWTRWGDLADPELDAHLVDGVRRAGTHIMGRITYDEHAAYWPDAVDSTDPSERAIAELINAADKTVFSRSLQHADWPGTAVARGDTAAEIARLKSQPGGDILAVGGLRFLRSLVRQGLYDSLRLFVLPYAAGSGTSIFDELDAAVSLRLASVRAFPSGVCELVFDRASP